MLLTSIAVLIFTSTTLTYGFSVKAKQQTLSNTQVAQIKTLLNNVLSYDENLMKNDKYIDYSNVINEKKLLQMIQKDEKYKQTWYKDINFKIKDYNSSVTINNINQLNDGKYQLDVTFKAQLILGDDSKTDSSTSENYKVEIQNKSGKWVINKLIDEQDYNDTIKDNNYNSSLIQDNSSVVSNNNKILDEKISEVNSKLSNISESVKDYNNMMDQSKKVFIDGSEKANPSYTGTNRNAIAIYAYNYAYNYNPHYTYISGADCTNFASQAIHNGGVPENNYWKPYTSDWVNVEGLYSYMTSNGYSCDGSISIGDISQWKHSYKSQYSHSTIISGHDNTGWLLSAHSNDRRNWPISNYWANFSSERRLHFW